MFSNKSINLDFDTGRSISNEVIQESMEDSIVDF